MLPGGVLEGTGPDAGVALHYGDPAAEARALESGRALVDLSQLEVVTITGPERLTWLHLFTSQHVAALAPGTSTETLILSPPGQIEHAAALLDDGATTWLITEPGRGAPLVTFLERMRFAARVEVSLAGDRAVVAVANPRSTPAALADLLGPAPRWQDPWPATTGASYGPDDAAHPAAGRDLALVLTSRPGLDELAERWTGAGGVLAGTWALEAERIAAWRPRLGREVDERSIPHELDWLRTAVHLDKGCYRGQETVARVVNLGRPPRRLTFLHLDGSAEALPAPGDPVFAGEREAGVVTSAARHHELGPIALALLKRSVGPDAELVVRASVPDPDGGEPGSARVSATQEEIVSAQGRSSATPGERPGAGLRGSGARNPNPAAGFGKN
ncbi:MAG: glycine cleavage T C-terminal barrel domain-containing protein [bacterium]|nr:glycine cleavage T C-terminal barrel domain-containing protein [bacterium]